MKNNSRSQKSPKPSGNPKEPITCANCQGDDIIVDTGVCSIPKGRDRDRDLLRYQTLCTTCGTIGSVELTEAQLKVIIQREDKLVDDLLVAECGRLGEEKAELGSA